MPSSQLLPGEPSIPDPGYPTQDQLVEMLARLGDTSDSDRARKSTSLRTELENRLVRERLDAETLAVTRWHRRLTRAVRRAERAEHRLARTEQRRSVRFAQAMATLVRHPFRLGTSVPALLQSLTRPSLPPPPAPQKVPLDLPRFNAAASRMPYPHLRIAHAGRLRVFDGLAPHEDVSSLADVDPERCDLLLLEPGVGDALELLDVGLVRRLADAGVPSVLIARTTDHLSLPHASRVTLTVVEDDELAGAAAGPVLVLGPSVDPRLHNPTGWSRRPDGDTLDLDRQPELWGEELVAELKNHRLAVTGNLSRALVAAACGTPVASPSNSAFDEHLDGHYLPTDPKEETPGEPADDVTRERLSVAARRHVLTFHTRLARLEQLLDHFAIPVMPPPRVSVLLATKRPERLEAALSNVEHQDWPDLEVILMLHDGTIFDRSSVDDLLSKLRFPSRVLECPKSWTLGDCLNAGLGAAGGEYIAKMDDDDDYGPRHLRDLLVALEYAEAAAVGKLSNVTYLSSRDLTVDWRLEDQEGFVHHLPGATMMMRREIALRYRFNRVPHGVDSALWERMRGDGLKLYSTHRMNFVRHRHDDHTYQRDNDDFLRLAKTTPQKGLDTGLWFV